MVFDGDNNDWDQDRIDDYKEEDGKKIFIIKVATL